ncbi:MAG: bifunctional nuclease family protein [Chitinophagales bacterium]
MDDKIELEIINITHSVSTSNSFAVVLGELKGVRRMPIVIGPFEAQSIAVAIEKVKPNRPLTHDLIFQMFNTFHAELNEVWISDLKGGIFYARLHCSLNGKSYELDSRTSDAIALAIRFECPIYTYNHILEQAGIVMDDDVAAASKGKPEAGVAKEEKQEKGLGGKTLGQLQKLLDKTLQDEDYELAARIRDEINKREND